MSSENFKPGKYRHYKGKEYEAYRVVHHSESLEPLVYYRCLYENDINEFWVRPLEMFLERVTIDGISKDRFEWMGPLENS